MEINITASQQNLLAEATKLARGTLTQNDPVAAEAMRAIGLLVGQVDLEFLEELLRTTGHNNSGLTKLRALKDGDAVVITADEKAAIDLAPVQDRGPCLQICADATGTGGYIIWRNQPPQTLHLIGNFVDPIA